MKAELPPLDDADYVRLADFRRALRGFLAFSSRAAAAAGIRPQQYQALLTIRARSGQSPVTIGALAAELMIRPHSAVGLVDRLERRGLVRRSAQGGRVAVVLTGAAQALLDGLAAVHLAELRRVGDFLAPLMRPRA